MYDRILLPTDGSETASTAATAAITLASRFDAELHIIYVIETESLPYVSPNVRDELAQRGHEAVAEVSDRATDYGIDMTTTIVEEDKPAHRGILEYADTHEIGLIVMGTYGRTGLGRLILGSVTEQTLRAADVPVMTVRGETDIDRAFDSILVPFDGSQSALTAVDEATQLAARTDGTVHFLNVVDHGALTGNDIQAGRVLEALKESGEQALETATERAKQRDITIGDVSVQVGSPSRTIIDHIETVESNCVVMGTHGRSGVNRVLIGSVAERVIRKADVPVITTRADDAD
jgi:nucleotide-binding universal stress UspA family protein